MSYLAGEPIPSSTCVNDSATLASVVVPTARSVTVPGSEALIVPVESPPEHASAGRIMISPKASITRYTRPNIYDIGGCLLAARLVFNESGEACNKKAAATPTMVGFAGGSA